MNLNSTIIWNSFGTTTSFRQSLKLILNIQMKMYCLLWKVTNEKYTWSQNVSVQKMSCSSSCVKHQRVEDRFFNSRITYTYYFLQDSTSSPKNIPLSIFAMTRALCLWILIFSVQQSQCTDIVTLNLYYEPLCPDCQQFINQQLGPNYKRFEKAQRVQQNAKFYN